MTKAVAITSSQLEGIRKRTADLEDYERLPATHVSWTQKKEEDLVYFCYE